MSHFPVSLHVSSNSISLSLLLFGWPRPGGPPASSLFTSPLFPSLSLQFCLFSVCTDDQKGRSVLSLQDFGSHTIGLRFRVQTPFCLAGKLNKERKEGEEMKAFWRVVQGREVSSKSLHIASCVSLWCRVEGCVLEV